MLSIPDRNRRVPDRQVPFPISRNIEFIFLSGRFPLPFPTKNTRTEMVKVFSQPFPTVFIPPSSYKNNSILLLGQFIISNFVKDFIAFVSLYTSPNHIRSCRPASTPWLPEFILQRGKNRGDGTQTCALVHQDTT
jgi:hypothetical protein